MEPSPIQSQEAAQRTSPLTAHPRRRRSGRILLPLTLLLSLIPILPLGLDSQSAPRGKYPSYPRLTGDFEPLRAAFNHDGGAVRLLLLLDPT